MPDEQLIPLYVFGTLMVTGFTVAIIISLIIQKQRQVRNRLAQQKLEFEYSRSLLNTRIEVQETTLNQVAQELHDNIVQSLTGCFMQVSALANKTESSTRAELVEEAKENIKEVISGVRLLSHNLATGMIEQRELHDAIQTELSRLQTFSNLHCTLRSQTINELNPQQRLITFRIVQEVLQNVLKHAHAKRISVLIDSVEDHYRIQIRDDGVGFDRFQQQSTQSMGLVSMHERAAMLKGKLTILSEKTKGTEVNILIPLDAANGKD
jgi:signal transduction histidine kinase